MNCSRNTILSLLMFCLVICLLQGCHGKQSTPIQNASAFYDIYNAQYYDYMVQTGYQLIEGDWKKVTNPVLSEAQKKILKEKKRILEKVYPLIRIYGAYAVSGGEVPPETYNQIVVLLNQL